VRGAGPPPATGGEYEAFYLDGQTAARQPARVRPMATGLSIALADGRALWWRYAEIRQTQGAYAGEQVRFERGEGIGEALLVPDVGVLAALHRIASDSGGRFHDPARRRQRVTLVALAGVAVVALVAGLYLWAIPALAGFLAGRVPVPWEERLGEAVVRELAGTACRDPARVQAIDRIVARLVATSPGSPYTFRVLVVDRPAVNAFAAPGGHVVVYRGLIEQATRPEELAGVLAHELQHVLRRHVTRALFQQASTGLLLTALTGDVTGVVAYGLEAARMLGTLRYSRQAEEEADAEGLRMLAAAGIDGTGLVTFFESLAKREGSLPGALGYLSTHPSTADRIARLRALAAPARPGADPLLPPETWADLRRICQAEAPR
jgi:Zn-dependent protease with chaperone function